MPLCSIPRLYRRSDLRYTQQVFTQGKAAIRKQEKLKNGEIRSHVHHIKYAFHIITQTAKAISLSLFFQFRRDLVKISII